MAPHFSLDKKRIRILLLEGIHPSAVAAFEKAGYSSVEYIKTALDAEALEKRSGMYT